MIPAMNFLTRLESPEVLLEGHCEIGKVLMLLCDASWAVKRQVVLLLRALGRDGSLGDEKGMLQRLLRHPDVVVQLLVARILEHIPHLHGDNSLWKRVISDRNVALLAVQQSGLALEFVDAEFQKDREIVLPKNQKERFKV